MTSTDNKLDAILGALTKLSERVEALETATPQHTDEEEALARQYALDPDSVCAWCHAYPITLGDPCPRCGNRAARGPVDDLPMGDVVVDNTGTMTEFRFPEPSPERAAERRAFENTSLGLAGALGDATQDWNDLYAKAGPFWLYQHNRDLVMTYPPHIRRVMVHDVEQDSPKLAYEMARDVLKEGCGEPDLETGFGALGIGNITSDKVRAAR